MKSKPDPHWSKPLPKDRKEKGAKLPPGKHPGVYVCTPHVVKEK